MSSKNLTTSSFLRTLRQHGRLPLVFRAHGSVIAPGYHLTEVKRVSYETMDCGAMTHRWAETHFEIWVPPLEAVTPGRGHMPAEKFLRIIDRVEQELKLDGETPARVHASFTGQPAALYDVTAVDLHDGQLWVELAPDRTRCKAAERRGGGEATGPCCGGGDALEQEKSAPASGCGCSSPAPVAAASQVACCT